MGGRGSRRPVFGIASEAGGEYTGAREHKRGTNRPDAAHGRPVWQDALVDFDRERSRHMYQQVVAAC
jgi:hypothetical protein